MNVEDRMLKITLTDLYGNFEGLPEYQGCRSATLVFNGVTGLTMDVELDEGVRISALEIVPELPDLKLEIDLNIGGGSISRGRRSVTAIFRSLQIQEV
jgi:hypothetical protein